MQKNFPRALPNAGWHHRPGHYDDIYRLKEVYRDFDLREEEVYRVEAEAAWWHLHNKAMFDYRERDNILHVGYEDLCLSPVHTLNRIADFLEVDFNSKIDIKMHSPKEYPLSLLPSSIHKIDFIAGELNKCLYPDIRK
jgi:hypothetical protein